MSFVRNDFPFFAAHPDLAYLDSAATTQKPQAVLDAITSFYVEHNAQVYRGVYALAEEATELFEQARYVCATYYKTDPQQIVFTKGTTESINLLAAAWGAHHLKQGDEIILSELEHHANIVPWLMLERSHGIVVKYIPLAAHGQLNYEIYASMVGPKTKLVAITHTSNVLGTRVDLHSIISQAQAVGARVLVDATQAAGREQLELDSLEADFVAFSGHKMLGPTGIGVCYIAKDRLDELHLYQTGGGMVDKVTFHDFHRAPMPRMLEAGTPPIAQAIGLKAALEYLQSVDLTELKRHEAALCSRLIKGLEKLGSITILGPHKELAQSGHLVSFYSTKAHAHDVAAWLDKDGICVRAGQHCAQPLHTALGIDASVRASMYGYTTHDEIDRLIHSLQSFERAF